MLVRDQEMAERFERQAIPLLDGLYGAARRLTRNRSDAEDLVQDTMLKAYGQFHSLRDAARVEAWLHRIMHNTWLNNYRRSQSRPSEQLVADVTDWQEARCEQHGATRSRPVEIDALESLPDRKVVEALEALPEGLRMAVYYADVHGYRYREIAEILNIPIGTVMSRLHTARRRLRELLTEAGHAYGYG